MKKVTKTFTAAVYSNNANTAKKDLRVNIKEIPCNTELRMKKIDNMFLLTTGEIDNPDYFVKTSFSNLSFDYCSFSVMNIFKIMNWNINELQKAILIFEQIESPFVDDVAMTFKVSLSDITESKYLVDKSLITRHIHETDPSGKISSYGRGAGYRIRIAKDLETLYPINYEEYKYVMYHIVNEPSCKYIEYKLLTDDERDSYSRKIYAPNAKDQESWARLYPDKWGYKFLIPSALVEQFNLSNQTLPFQILDNGIIRFSLETQLDSMTGKVLLSGMDEYTPCMTTEEPNAEIVDITTKAIAQTNMKNIDQVKQYIDEAVNAKLTNLCKMAETMMKTIETMQMQINTLAANNNNKMNRNTEDTEIDF